MTTDLEQLARAKQREAKQVERESQEAAKRRKAEIRRKKLEEMIATKRKFLMGEKIFAAKLSHEEKAVLCGIISRSDLTHAERELLSDFTMHVVHSTPSLKSAATEFSRTVK
jgi:hypothetical protein